MNICQPYVNEIILVLTFVIGVMIGIAIGLLWSWRYSGDSRSEEELDTDPDFIGDGVGNWWSKHCPDCGANMVVMGIGDCRCSSECWIHQPHKNSMGGTEER